MMKDRFINGFLSGIMAGIIVLLALCLPAKYLLRITDRIFMDYGMMLVMFTHTNATKGVLAYIVGILAHLGVSTICGISFAYLIKQTTNKYFLSKGAIFGSIVWFILSSIGTIYRLPLFTKIPPNDALVALFISIIWGIITAFTLSTLEKREKVISSI